jgi:hypothetical protein
MNQCGQLALVKLQPQLTHKKFAARFEPGFERFMARRLIKLEFYMVAQ